MAFTFIDESMQSGGDDERELKRGSAQGLRQRDSLRRGAGPCPCTNRSSARTIH
jgi:hypothetical protein